MRADDKNSSPNRRAVLSTIGIAAAAAAAPSFAAAAATSDSAGEFWSKQYTAKKGAVNLALYRRRMKAPAAGEKPLPVVVMVHGSSISGMPSWDLHVPGAGEYSVMNVFSRLGYDCWVIDFEGYGRSTVTSGNSDVKSGVADLEAATPIISQETGQQKFHMLGESSGALRVAAFAAAQAATRSAPDDSPSMWNFCWPVSCEMMGVAASRSATPLFTSELPLVTVERP